MLLTYLLHSFLQLLQFLQSNLTGFKELHLNFSDGRVLENNKMSIAKPVVDNITMAVHCTLDNFSNSASKRMDSEIDTQSGKEVVDLCINQEVLLG